MRLRLLCALLVPLLWVLMSAGAHAQSCPTTGLDPAFNSGGTVFGRNAAQWNTYLGSKVDANNGVLCNPVIVGGNVMQGFQVAPGLTDAIGTRNTSVSQIVDGGTVFQQSWPVFKSSSYIVNSDNGGTSDTGALLVATASITFSLPNPSPQTQGNKYSFTSTSTGYTLTTLGHTATIYGCQGPGTGAISYTFNVNIAVTLTDDGANYACTSSGVSAGGLNRYNQPAVSSYTASSTDNGNVLSAHNATGSPVGWATASLPVTLPAPNFVGAGWTFAAVSDNNHAVVLNPPGGVFILVGGQQYTTLVTGPGNHEFVTLFSDGTNFRVLSSTPGTLQYNGAVGAPDTRWTFPASSPRVASVTDNGAVLSPTTLGAALTITLPSTTSVVAGWSMMVSGDAYGETVNVNGVSGGWITGPGGAGSATSYVVPPNTYAAVQFDGTVFRIVPQGVGSYAYAFPSDATIGSSPYTLSSVNINSYPSNGEIPAGVMQVDKCAMVVPSGHTGGAPWPDVCHAAYIINGENSSSGSSVVGYFGIYTVMQPNALVSHSNGILCNTTPNDCTLSTHGVGADFGLLDYDECNVNVAKVGSSTPNGEVDCFRAVGAGEVNPASDSYILHILPLGTNLPWSFGIATEAGGALIGAQFGPQNTGNSQNSQVVQFLSVNSGGIPGLSKIYGDLNGNLTLLSASNATGIIFNGPSTTFGFINATAAEAVSFIATGAAGAVSAGQVSFGGTTTASSSCGTLAGASGCLIINVAGTTAHVPYYP